MASESPPLEAPLLKVSRPIAACSRCRSAKIKCDGKLPACTACERAGKADSCLGKSDQFARGKERSYVASLEAQCERLEQKIEAVRRRRQRNTSSSAGNSLSPDFDAMETPPPPVTVVGDRSQRREESDIDDLVGDFGFLSVNATSRDFFGISSSTSFAGLLLNLSAAEPLPHQSAPTPFPPRPQAVYHIQYYLDNLYPITPFFHETKFWTSVDAVFQEDGRFSTGFDHFTVRMVLAITFASMAHTHRDRDHELALGHVSAALWYAEDVLHPGSVAGIQSILLLTLYSVFDPEHFNVWYLIGIAARVSVDLGIHQEQVSNNYLDRTVLDLRRKTFYCVYALDRYVSTALGRAFSFSDDSVSVALPTSTSGTLPDLQDSPGSLFLRGIEPALHLFRIRRIMSEAYHKMYFSSRKAELNPDSVWSLCCTANEWFDEVSKALPRDVAMHYRLEHLFTLTLFVSPSNSCPVPTLFNRFLLFQYAVDFISHLHDMIPKFQGRPFIVTYIDVQRAFNVSVKLLALLHSYYRELFYGGMPNPPAEAQEPQNSPPPPLHGARSRPSPKQALTCINNAISIFDYARTRWNVRTLLDDFAQRSEPIKVLLVREQIQQGQVESSLDGGVKVESDFGAQQLGTVQQYGVVEGQAANYNISHQPGLYPP